MIFHDTDASLHVHYKQADYVLLRPSLVREKNDAYVRCDFAILIAKDFKDVLIGGGEFGFDGLARRADLIEIKAMAMRFNLPQLWKVVETLNGLGGSAHP